MTDKELKKIMVKQLKVINRELGEKDTEMAHVHADDVLCDLLIVLGYDEVVSEWEKIPKWYA